jgi:hypothetical protein
LTESIGCRNSTNDNLPDSMMQMTSTGNATVQPEDLASSPADSVSQLRGVLSQMPVARNRKPEQRNGTGCTIKPGQTAAGAGAVHSQGVKLSLQTN